MCGRRYPSALHMIKRYCQCILRLGGMTLIECLSLAKCRVPSLLVPLSRVWRSVRPTMYVWLCSG